MRNFVECLTRLDPIANEPGEFDRFLAVAQTRFQLPPRALIALLEAVAPKIDAFVTVPGADLGAAPNLVTTFSTALARHVTVPVGS
ncbi:hypothetical protein J8F10_05970 [Gemmata sp. G18]|uniref:Uncharacterized protein n=1 Tax=Gemmata palustris TaxID=2822762 RepID=A0ABS5BM87_9BACT|nr:hypothetical protein [Gemmata palustris]MBP3954828.1 hypothetical protein [Gemmata palustris]